MLKHVTLLGTSLLALSLSTAVMAQDVTGDTVVAKVGDTEITVGQIIVARAQLPQQYAQFPNEALFDGLVDQLIQQQLLADTLVRVPSGIEHTLINERRSLMAGEAVNLISNDVVTDATIQAAYDAKFADIAQINEYNASHLLVGTQEEALAAKARIDEGAAFADVARDVSTGPTGPNGGNLGWFSTGAMVKEFEDVITALDVGQVSDPFETQFGWHVAMLNEIRLQPRPSLEETRTQISNELQEAAITAKLDALAATQVIVKPEPGTFDPNIVDQLELLE